MKNKIIYELVCCFIFAFLLVYLSIAQRNDMIIGSFDAKSIWQTITSFYSGAIQSSFVLYKGIHSVYPYVWFYELSRILNVNAFLFIKIYFAILFAYATAIGMPYIISKLIKIDIHIFQRIISILIVFWIFQAYGVFRLLWTDLPNFSYLVMATVAVLKISQLDAITHKTYLYCLIAGLLCGLAGGEGRYAFTALLLPLYAAIQLFRTQSDSSCLKSTKMVAPFVCIGIILSGVATLKFADFHFEKTLVQPFRSKGEWIPEGIPSFQYHLYARLLLMGYGSTIIRSMEGKNPELMDHRGTAILKVTEGENFENEVKFINAGGMNYSDEKYLNMIVKHPLDFLSRWGNRFFLALNMDAGASSAVRIFVGFTLLYLSLFSVYKNCKTVNSLFRPGIFIIAVFVMPSLIPCLIHIEKRYVIAIQALIISFGLFDDTLKGVCFSFSGIVQKCKEQKSVKPFWHGNISYHLVTYILFIVICFLHHAVIMETFGPDPGILFTP